MKKKTSINLLSLLFILFFNFPEGSTNPLLEAEITEFSTSPDSFIKVEINPVASDTGYFSLDGSILETEEGIAYIDSGLGHHPYVVITNDSLLSGKISFNPEGDILKLYSYGRVCILKFGTKGPAPSPLIFESCANAFVGSTDYFWTLDASPTFGSANDTHAEGPPWGSGGLGNTQIVINEINVHSSTPGGNFFELYNKTDSSIDISGWQIVVDSRYTIPSGAIIPGKGFYVLWQIDFPPGFDPTVTADNVYLFSADSIRRDQAGWSHDHGIDTSFIRYPDGDATCFTGYNDTTSIDFEDGIPTPGAPNVRVTEVEEQQNAECGVQSAECRLVQNYPNPFISETVIEYSLSEPSVVSLQIYDIQGKLVRVLTKAKKEAGYHSIHWDRKDESGERVSSGIYLCKLSATLHGGSASGGQSEDFSAIRKMIVLK
ncbi:MAG: lamin tail domain-containing protein [Candidatus Edwardsbacteria bacterium]